MGLTNRGKLWNRTGGDSEVSSCWFPRLRLLGFSGHSVGVQRGWRQVTAACCLSGPPAEGDCPCLSSVCGTARASAS